MFPTESQEKTLAALEENDQIVFKYTDPDGNLAGYPWNPNGSPKNIAGICNKNGNVLGMMPHPERIFYKHTHNNWTRKEGQGTTNEGDGQIIFRNAIEHAKNKL